MKIEKPKYKKLTTKEKWSIAYIIAKLIIIFLLIWYIVVMCNSPWMK